MAFDFKSIKNLYGKAAEAVEWIVAGMIHKKNWLACLLLLNVILFAFLNPHQWPFQGLLTN
jgi:hypothetical protein